MPRINKRKLYILTFILLIIVIFWVIPIPNFIAAQISVNNIVKDEAVGIGGIKPVQYRLYETMKALSSTEKLEEFYKCHPSPVVKCYAFWGLLERNDVNYFELIKFGINDDRIVSTQFGCMISHSTVADFILVNSIGLLSTKDSLFIDSLILFSDKHIRAQKLLLMEMKPNPTYYERIKAMSMDNDVPSAIIGLARYKRESDVDLIRKALSDTINDPYYTLLAVKNYPDQSFVDPVLDIHDKMIKNANRMSHISLRALYKALVSFENEKVKQKLNWIINVDKELQYINSLPDSIKVYTAFQKEYFKIEKDSSNYLMESDFSKDDEYIIHCHVEALMLALLDNAESKYHSLITKIKLERYELEMINDELKFFNYE